MKKSTTYGYIVIPDGDDSFRADRIKALEEFVPDCIMADTEYKTRTDRTSLDNIITLLKPNDVLITAKLSNLGRSYAEILEYWNRIMEKLAFVITLEHPIIDTRPKKQGAEKAATEFLSFLSEMENERAEKVTNGLAAAKLKGIKPGPKSKIPEQFYAVKEKWESGRISAREAGRQLGVNDKTFARWVRNSQT